MSPIDALVRPLKRMSKVFIALLSKYKYLTEEKKKIARDHQSPRDESRQIDSAIMGRRRDQVTQLVETPVPAERALSESWSFVGSGPGDAGADRSRGRDITPSRDQVKPS